MLTYSSEKIIEEWKKDTIFDIKMTKRDNKSGKIYKPFYIDLERKLKVIGEDEKEEIIDAQFPFIKYSYYYIKILKRKVALNIKVI